MNLFMSQFKLLSCAAIVILLLLFTASSLLAQHQHGTVTAPQWAGSAEGKAYSEFNHHIAGVFVLLIGLSELRGALAVSMLAWSRFLLPLAMLGAGGYLMIWSDHDAWPI